MNFRQWIEENQTKKTPQIRNQKILILMRGLPGSGKSYTAQKLLNYLGSGDNEYGHIFSIDHEFTPETVSRRKSGIEVSKDEEDREYHRNFSFSRRPAMVRRMIQRFRESVDQGVTPLIVDNTNIKTEHMRGFADHAEKNGYEVRVQYPESEHWKQGRDALRTKDPEAMQSFARALRQAGRHNVPEETLIQMMKSWDHAPAMADILGRDPTPK